MVTLIEPKSNLKPALPLKACESCKLLAKFPRLVLCFDCTCGEDTPIRDYELEEAEDAALYKEGMRIWEKACADARVIKMAEDDLWVEEQWQKIKPEWEKQEAELLQKHLEETDPWEALKARERAVKDRELSRREKRQDGYDDAEGKVETNEPLSAFETPMDGSDLDIAPIAMLQRMDCEPLLYKGKINWLFGSPGGGKSWMALYCVHETLLQGHRVAYWDHEDVAATLKRRSKLLGLDLVASWGEGQFKYIRTGMDGSSLAMAEVMEWATGGDGPTLIVIDSAESAGCPSDGADVAPWLKKMVQPFLEAGCTILVLDHVAKHKEGRPLGPIGSQHKLAKVDGAALFVSGIPWTQKSDGHLVLTNHKDRHGMLPAPNGKAVARVIVTHEGETLNMSIVSPEAEDNIEES